MLTPNHKLVLLLLVAAGSVLPHRAHGQAVPSGRPVRLSITVETGTALANLDDTYGVEVALAPAWPVSLVGRVAHWGLGEACKGGRGTCYTDGWSWEAGGVLQSRAPSRLQPFLGVSVGQMTTTEEFRGQRHRFRMRNVYGGLDLALSRSLALRAAGRYATLLRVPDESPQAAGLLGIRWTSPRIW